MAFAVSDVARDEIEVRPRRRASRSWIAIAAWGGAVALGVLSADGQTRGITAVAGALTALVTWALVHRWRRRSVLALRDQVLSYTGVFRSRTVVRLPGSVRAVTAQVTWSSGALTQRWLLVDASGAVALGLDLTAWETDDLSAVCERAGIPQVHDPTRRRPAELRRAYPGGLPWVVAHPFVLCFLLIGAGSVVLALLGAS